MHLPGTKMCIRDRDCKVYMVKCSYEQKPFRREVMRTYGASVTPSPSETTEVGRKILAEHPGTSGSLGLSLIHIYGNAYCQKDKQYKKCRHHDLIDFFDSV